MVDYTQPWSVRERVRVRGSMIKRSVILNYGQSIDRLVGAQLLEWPTTQICDNFIVFNLIHDWLFFNVSG